LRDELIMVQRQRDLVAEKTRELQANKLRVRPKDVKTLARAKALVNPNGVDLNAEAVRGEEESVAQAQAQVDRLSRRQRVLLQETQGKRVDLERDLVEERYSHFSGTRLRRSHSRDSSRITDQFRPSEPVKYG